MTPHRTIEIAIGIVLRDPAKLNILMIFDIMFCNETGKVLSDIISVVDIIMNRIHQNNIFLGVILLIYTFDHTQLQSLKGNLLLSSTHVVPCFKFVILYSK